MKIQHFVDKVEKTKEYKDFMKKYPKTYLCSLFFVRDFSENHNETHIDYYTPSTKKIISFDLDKKVTKSPIDKKAENMKHEKFVPKKLGNKIKLDIDRLKPIILDEMHNRGLTDNIQKMIIILQNIENRDVWNCTCFLNGLGLLQCKVEDSSETVLFMEKQSFFDLIKIFRK
jgi:hypothetical protein